MWKNVFGYHNRNVGSMVNPSIKMNWIFSLANKLLSYLVPLIVSPYVSRIFEADGIGICSYTSANVTYFTLLCMLGIGGYGQRCIAQCRENKGESSRLFWELFVLHGITSGIALILYIVLLVVSDKFQIYYAIDRKSVV